MAALCEEWKHYDTKAFKMTLPAGVSRRVFLRETAEVIYRECKGRMNIRIIAPTRTDPFHYVVID